MANQNFFTSAKTPIDIMDATQVIAEERSRPLDCFKGEVFRVRLVPLKERENAFLSIFTAHHACVDGVSIGILQRYENKSNASLVDFLLDFVVYRDLQISTNALEDDERYWKIILKCATEALRLPWSPRS